MSKILNPLIAIVLSVFALAGANSNEGKKMTEDEKNVLSAVINMTNAFHAGDIEGVMNSYEDGATVVFEPEKPVSDVNVLTQMFEGAFTMKPQFDYSGHEVFVSGDIAVHFAPWTMSATAPDGEAVTQTGLSVAILRKQSDGSWKMVIDNPHGQNLMDKQQ